MREVHHTEEYRGFKFTVEDRTPCPGIGWVIHSADGKRRESGGAFYDTCEDHPEGAVAWASENARQWIDRVRKTLDFVSDNQERKTQ